MDRFEICHPVTASWEGGWSNHKDDPGGATMYGVTQAVYTAWRKANGRKDQSVRLITRDEALSIYRTNYWEPTAGKYKLFPGVDLCVYDASVNSGVSRGIKWLKASVGSNDHSETVKRICRARLSFMQSLTIWKTFGKGWGRRVADIEVKGVAMALTAMGKGSSEIKAAALIETTAAEKSVKSAKTTEKVAAAGAAADVAAVSYPDTSSIDWGALAALGFIGAGIIALLIFTNLRKRAAQERLTAYAALAEGVTA